MQHSTSEEPEPSAENTSDWTTSDNTFFFFFFQFVVAVAVYSGQSNGTLFLFQDSNCRQDTAESWLDKSNCP